MAKLLSAKQDPFDVTLDEAAERELVNDLCNEVLLAQDAIKNSLDDIDYWWTLYESGSSKVTRDDPWPGAADLTSYIGTEKTDAMHARLYKNIVSAEPIWTIDGWGNAAKRAAVVEEFHEWKADEEELDDYLDKVMLSSLVETMGILEVYEVGESIRQKVTRTVKVKIHDDGTWVMDENGHPELAKDDGGRYIDAGEDDPRVEAVIDQLVKVRGGPGYRVLPERDFLILPAHARDRKDVWGYVKRFWRRVPELMAKQAAGIYKNIEQLGASGDRVQEPIEARANVEIAAQIGPTAEKELFEGTILRDLDGDGIEEWYIATFSVEHQTLIRLKHDDLGADRYILFIPFPRPGMVRGYSFIGHKLYTLIEEHTGQRNMNADRSVLAVNAPLLRHIGSQWDPFDQPFGPGAIIDVRDMKEIQALMIPDLPASAVEREHMTLQASERVAGINDISLGVQASSDRTLGENQMATAQSAVRMDLVTKRLQRAMKQLWKTRHALLKRALKHAPAEPPQRVIQSLMLKQQTLEDGKFTAELLEGDFRGKPHGSVETADILGQRSDFNNGMVALANLAKVNPGIAAKLAGPDMTHALLEEWAHVYRVQDRQAFLGTAAVQAQATPGQPPMPGQPPADPLAGVTGMLPAVPGPAMPPPPAPMQGGVQ